MWEDLCNTDAAEIRVGLRGVTRGICHSGGAGEQKLPFPWFLLQLRDLACWGWETTGVGDWGPHDGRRVMKQNELDGNTDSCDFKGSTVGHTRTP